MPLKKVYLDNAGAGLISDEQRKSLAENVLKDSILANPHSTHESGRKTNIIVENVRNRILSFFGASKSDYSVIFTSNTTHALEMTARLFHYNSKSNQPIVASLQSVNWNHSVLMMFKDSHTSILGMRNYFHYEQLVVTTYEELNDYLNNDPKDVVHSDCNHLFSMTAESNFCGRKYDLDLINRLRKKIPSLHVILDSAAWVATSKLDVTNFDISFMAFSFYKMVGFPTGLGALLLKRGREHLLRQNYFGGGTVNYISLEGFEVDRKEEVSTRFEQGTIDFYAIAALNSGFDDLERLGGMEQIEEGTMKLAENFYHFLSTTTHHNGRPIAVLYGNGWKYFGTDKLRSYQGPIVNFNLLRDDGNVIGYVEVEKMADLYGIDLRTGCMCNQGACSEYLGLDADVRIRLRDSGKECGDEMDTVDGRPAGSLRVSIGRLNTMEDIRWLKMMISTCFVNSSPDLFTTFNADDIPRLGELSKISVYPLKSASAMVVSSWKTSNGGLKWDRKFMVVTSEGVPITQKQHPEMCSVKCQFSANSLLLKDRQGVENDLEIDLDRVGREVNSRVCVKDISALDCGDLASEWLKAIGLPSGCRLLRLDSEDDKQNFSNHADYLLISKASIDYMADVTGLSYHEVEGRFRSNFVVNFGSNSAFLEDKMERIFIGSTEFEVTGKCTRCQMICIDQKTGEKNPNVLMALRNLRGGTSMTFGVYLKQVKQHEAAVRQGQKVFVTGVVQNS
ncbi:unnamed protein product [Bursaphelenchus xylophilus]|uniref:(pine wood nematode) hypothetical protein n=1 Tax=Bursaphelenchus xylophilus TaxID=6326 RepID=A0A1I7SLU4_BURXY|nr:unnamed protein product [Bursaphelenchus xylophilus]CAG9129844.1 unnamed protein product [Bursaphelenchus xylophilus]